MRRERAHGRVLWRALAALALLVSSVPAAAQVVGTGTGLIGTYYDQNGQQRQYFTGSTVVQLDPEVNFNWGGGSPTAGIGNDDFSIRWDGEVQAQYSESYRFVTRSDDGVRLWVDGNLIIDNWTDHPPTTNTSVAVNLVAGARYDIRLEYYERGGGAVIELSWRSGSTPQQIIPATQLYPASDVDPPTIDSAGVECGINTAISVVYSEPVDPVTATDTANYRLNRGANVLGATLLGDGRTVQLTTTPLDANRVYRLRVDNVQDRALPPNTIAPNTRVDITAVSGVLSPGILGTYYDQNGQQRQYFTGNSIQRSDATIDFDWGAGQPDAAIPDDDFSVVWNGLIVPSSSTNYTFRTRSDDGVRLWVNGQQLIDNWSDHSATLDTAASSVALTAGEPVTVQMEYYERGGQAVAELQWRPGLGAFDIVPADVLFTCQPGAPQVQPVAYYPMDETSWDGTPGEVADASGSGNDGTSVGGIDTMFPGKECRAGEVPFNNSRNTIEGVDTGIDVDTDIGNTGTVNFWYRSRNDWRGGGNRQLLDASTFVPALGNASKYFYLSLNNNGRLYFGLEDENDRDYTANTQRFNFAAEEWVHVAITWDFDNNEQQIFVDGVLERSRNMNNADDIGDVGPIVLGDNSSTYLVGQSTGNSANGDIDEVYVYDTVLTEAEIQADRDATHICPLPLTFQINHDNFGINCLAETISVTTIDPGGLPFDTYNELTTLDTGSGRGTWALVSGGGTFIDAVPDDGLATYQWPIAREATAVFALSYPEGPATINVDIFQTDDPGLRDNDTEGDLLFSPNGYTVTASALPNPVPGVIQTFDATQVAATDFELHIAAYGQTPTDASCGIIETYDGLRDVAFWFDYDDPVAGTRAVTIDGTGIASGEGAAATQPVAFAAGQAVVTARYKDAGRIRVSMKDENEPNPEVAAIRGATAAFVVRPERLELTGIRRTDNGAGNPGALDAAGDPFIGAGEPFTAEVTAYDAEGDPTPNFGQESTLQPIGLVVDLVAPLGGQSPGIGLNDSDGFDFYAGGSSTADDLSWPEVGIIRLTPTRDDYLGATDADIPGVQTTEVGRFTPHELTVSRNTPAFDSGCSAGGYTYMGEVFDYRTNPVLDVTAVNLAGGTTRNYTGDFFKLTNGSLENHAYSAASGTLDAATLPDPMEDPAIVDLGAGLARLTFDLDSGIPGNPVGLAFERTAPEAPFNADIDLQIDVKDADDVEATPLTQTFASIAFPDGGNMRYGRIRLTPAAGPEILPLAVPMVAEYYASAATGFVPHADDTCTTGATIGLGNYTGALAAGETCVLDAGQPGVSGEGCPAPAPAGSGFAAPPLAGDFNLGLQAPGGTNQGSVDVTADVPDYLEFDWDGASPGDEDPVSRATFGVYDGTGRQIYRRTVP